MKDVFKMQHSNLQPSVFKIIWPTPPPFHRTKSTGENKHLCHHVSSRTFNKFSCYQFMFTLNQKYKYKSFWRLCQLSNWLSHFPFDQWFSHIMGLDIRKAWPKYPIKKKKEGKNGPCSFAVKYSRVNVFQKKYSHVND